MYCEQDNEGADPISFDEPARPEMFGERSSNEDDFAVCHDEVELLDEEMANEAAIKDYKEIDFLISPDEEPTNEQLQKLEKTLEEAA